MERFWLLSYGLAWFLALALGFALFQLLSVLGRIFLRTGHEFRVLVTEDGPDIHTPLPTWEGCDLEGQPHSAESYRGQEYVMLIASPGCASCAATLKALPQVMRDRPARRYLLVTGATPEEARSLKRRFRLNLPIFPDPEGDISERMRVARTPFGFLVDEEGIVRMKGVVNNRDHLESLISRQGRFISNIQWDILLEESEQAPTAAADETPA